MSAVAGQKLTASGLNTLTQPGTWQTASLVNSWTASSGVAGVFYRLLPENSVEVIGDIINTTATGNSQFTTLAAGFRPAGTQNHPAGWNNPASSNSATPPWVSVASNGNMSLIGIEAANKEIFFHIFVPLGTL